MSRLLLLLSVACGPKTVLTTTGEPLAVQLDPQRVAEQERAAALAAYAEGDHEAFLTHTERALEAVPDSIVDRYNLACAHALLGHRDASLAALRVLADQGIDFGASRDPDFASLAEDPEFVALSERLDAMFPEVRRGERAFDFGDALGVLPEGIAQDPATGRFFVGSMRTGAVYAVDDEGPRELTRLSVGDVGVAALGMAVDEARDRLWVIGTAFGLREGFVPEQDGVTALFGLDLATGAIEEVRAPDPATGRQYNDLAVAPDGAVYLSGRGLDVWKPGMEAPVPMITDPPVRFSNGIAVAPGGGSLYLAADGARSVWRVDLGTGARRELALPEGVNLRSFDGLYHLGDALVGVQLGLGRWRVVRMDLDASGDGVTGIEVLEQGNPEIAGVTTGAVVGDDLVVITREPAPEGAPGGVLGGRTVGWRLPLRPTP